MVHLFTADNTFIPPRIFKDLNFSAGFLIMFAIGMILLSSMALLPPYLQNLGGYSITTTGLLMAPRGGRHHARHADRRPADQPHRSAAADVRRHRP